MPVTVSYPGVYIEEIPSGVRTITGVATSIAAIIGRALRGPTNKAVVINSFADFDRIFGGLWLNNALGYAVRDFYLNGGSQAIIVRLFHPTFKTKPERDQAVTDATAGADAVIGAATAAAGQSGATKDSVAQAARAKADEIKNDAAASAAKKTAADFVATAAENAAKAASATPADVVQAAQNAKNPAIGKAAPVTKAALHVNGLELEAANEGSWGNLLRARIDYNVKDPSDPNLFNLTVRDGGTGQIESFRNVSAVSGHPRQVSKVLENESTLVRVASPPAARPGKHGDPSSGQDIWSVDTLSTKVADADKASNGSRLDSGDFKTDQPAAKEGLFALEQADLFNLLCLPPYTEEGDVEPSLIAPAAAYCEKRRAMLLVDPRSDWKTKEAAKTGVATLGTSKNSAFFFPRLVEFDPLQDNRLEEFVPCGAVAGIFARTDTQRGVWKAPAGLDATLVGVPQLAVNLTDEENGELNPLGVNCLRVKPAAGPVVWGARTLQGNDILASEWKYVPVRRTALFIEESLYRGTQCVVFEPNDEPLWAQIRLNVGAFMQNLFRQGAFQGKTPREAYLVKCDKETTTQNDINLGIVNIVVGFAPLKPAEFVIIKIQQLAGQIET